jgi:predicted amidohydrolase YtcJ
MREARTKNEPSLDQPRGARREAHAHLVALGQVMQRVDLSTCVDVSDCLDRVAKAAAEVKVIHNFEKHGDTRATPRWLIAWGLRPEGWSDPRWPTMRELDGACSDIPCFIAGFDHHSAACNTLAFAHFGYHAHSSDPVGGTIVRDARGQPTGRLLESAYTRARDLLPQPDRAAARALVKSACDSLAHLGFAEVHDLLAQPWLGEVLADLDDAGELAVRVGVFAPMDVHDGCQAFDAFASSSPAWDRPNVRFLGGKLFADGTLNSATAAMLEPYREPIPQHPRGQLFLSEHDLRAAMDHLATLQAPRALTLAVHAIGDRAVRTVLDAHANVSRASRTSPSLRIEHAEVIDAADVPRFQKLGVTASVQPCHLLYDMEVLQRQLPHRLDRVLPLRELLDSGLTPGETLIFGSDVPIVRAEPMDSVLAAVERKRTEAPNRIAPAQAITRQEAWACFGPTSFGPWT